MARTATVALALVVGQAAGIPLGGRLLSSAAAPAAAAAGTAFSAVPDAIGAQDHFNRPTFMAWLPDGSFYVSDGYNGTRVAKIDADGKFQFDFGMRGESGKETRPEYMNNVHGVAVDVETRRVFVNDRDNHRIQIFDEKGTYISEWRIAVSPSSLRTLHSDPRFAAILREMNEPWPA